MLERGENEPWWMCYAESTQRMKKHNFPKWKLVLHGNSLSTIVPFSTLRHDVVTYILSHSHPPNHKARSHELPHPAADNIKSSWTFIDGPRPNPTSTSSRTFPVAPLPDYITHQNLTMSLSKFRTLLTTISAPKSTPSTSKPQITTTLRLLQQHNISNTQSTKMSTGTPNPAPATGTGPMKPTEPKQSMIGGHAQFVKGMVNEKIGQATGSQEWMESGKSDMAEGRGAMLVCVP